MKNGVFRNVFLMVVAFMLLFSYETAASTLTNSGASVAVSNGVSYQYMGQYSLSDINDILTGQLKQFSTFDIQYDKAKYAVNLYKATYTTVIPEKNNKSTMVQGLIAVPVLTGKGALPIVSYQHGTIFDKNQVPSRIDNSMETKLMVANFASQGYIVIAADYIGQGSSQEPNPWIVRDADAQSSYDLIIASKAVLRSLGVSYGGLFLSGWSQGSYNTLSLMRHLEQNGVVAKGAAVASSPNDVYLAFNRWIFTPSPLDVHYLVGTAAMMIFAYENYYDMQGLSQAAIKSQYWQTAKDFYEYKISWEDAAKVLPEKSKDLYQPQFLQALASGNSSFARQLQANSSYNWQYQTKTRFYYGKNDEVVTPYMVQLPVEYEKSIGGVVPQAIYAGDTADHRGTFLFGMKDQRAWFNGIESGK